MAIAIVLPLLTACGPNAPFTSELQNQSPQGQEVSGALDTGVSAEEQELVDLMEGIDDAQELLETVDHASDRVDGLLVAIRVRALLSASETLDDPYRKEHQDALEQYAEEIQRIATSTEFEGLILTDGSTTTLTVSVDNTGTSADTLTLLLGDLTASTLSVDEMDLSTSAGAQTDLDTVDAAIQSVATYRIKYGANQQSLQDIEADLLARLSGS